MLMFVMGLAGIGLIVSVYMRLVLMNIKKNANHKASCDFSENISCSKSLKSGYSFPTCGILFYSLIGVLGFFDAVFSLLVFAVMAVGCSCLSAYFIWFKVKVLCLPCIVAYAVNGILLFKLIQMWR